MENLDNNVFDQSKEQNVMTTSEWLVTLIITAIPLVGFIMLIVWAVGDDSNKNRKNYARASLILMIIVFVLVFVLYASLFATFIAAMSNMG